MRRLLTIAALLCAALVLAPGAHATRRPTVIGGDIAPPGSYPFMVALLYGSAGSTPSFLCGGTLIAPDRVLTAGHCTTNIERPGNEPASAYRVRYGFHAWRESPVKTVGVKAIIRNPDFDSTLIRNDSAILVLARPITGITPVPVADPAAAATVLTDHAPLKVVGWGTISVVNGAPLLPAELREGTVNYQVPAWCEEHVGSLFSAVDHICVANETTPARYDACYGDSGGPLLADLAGQPIQVGIVSWGFSCGTSKEAGVYTRIASYAAWLQAALVATRDEPATFVKASRNAVTARLYANGRRLACSVDRKVVPPGATVTYEWLLPYFLSDRVKPSRNDTVATTLGDIEAAFGTLFRTGRSIGITRQDSYRNEGFRCLVIVRNGVSATALVSYNSDVHARRTWPARVLSRRCSVHGCRLLLRLLDAGQVWNADVRSGDDDVDHTLHVRQVGAHEAEVRTGPLIHSRRYRVTVTFDLPYAAGLRSVAYVTG